jgi:hypothetical protein
MRTIPVGVLANLDLISHNEIHCCHSLPFFKSFSLFFANNRVGIKMNNKRRFSLGKSLSRMKNQVLAKLAGTGLNIQRLTRSSPDSFARILAAQPSMSLSPFAPFLDFRSE